jgi:hypothetical protein
MLRKLHAQNDFLLQVHYKTTTNLEGNLRRTSCGVSIFDTPYLRPDRFARCPGRRAYLRSKPSQVPGKDAAQAGVRFGGTLWHAKLEPNVQCGKVSLRKARRAAYLMTFFSSGTYQYCS